MTTNMDNNTDTNMDTQDLPDDTNQLVTKFLREVEMFFVLLDKGSRAKNDIEFQDVRKELDDQLVVIKNHLYKCPDGPADSDEQNKVDVECRARKIAKVGEFLANEDDEEKQRSIAALMAELSLDTSESSTSNAN